MADFETGEEPVQADRNARGAVQAVRAFRAQDGSICYRPLPRDEYFELEGQKPYVHIVASAALSTGPDQRKYLWVGTAGTSVGASPGGKMAHDVQRDRGWFVERVETWLQAGPPTQVQAFRAPDLSTNPETFEYSLTLGEYEKMSIKFDATGSDAGLETGTSEERSYRVTLRAYTVDPPSVIGSAIGTTYRMTSVEEKGALKGYSEPKDFVEGGLWRERPWAWRMIRIGPAVGWGALRFNKVAPDAKLLSKVVTHGIFVVDPDYLGPIEVEVTVKPRLMRIIGTRKTLKGVKHPYRIDDAGFLEAKLRFEVDPRVLLAEDNR